MNHRMAWTTTTLALTGGASPISCACTRSQARESENRELRQQIEFWRDYTVELERELARASARAWDTVAEVPVRGVWESIVDARLAGEPERTGVVWADLDRFKQVNDEHGHLAGDAVLRAVARRLEEAFAARSPVVTRLGGDEFGVVARDLDTASDLQRFGELMGERVTLPHGRSVLVEASVGVAERRDLPAGATREDLLRVADAGSYAMKKRVRGGEVRGASSPRARSRRSPIDVVGAAR